MFNDTTRLLLGLATGSMFALAGIFLVFASGETKLGLALVLLGILRFGLLIRQERRIREFRREMEEEGDPREPGP